MKIVAPPEGSRGRGGGRYLEEGGDDQGVHPHDEVEYAGDTHEGHGDEYPGRTGPQNARHVGACGVQRDRVRHQLRAHHLRYQRLPRREVEGEHRALHQPGCHQMPDLNEAGANQQRGN